MTATARLLLSKWWCRSKSSYLVKFLIVLIDSLLIKYWCCIFQSGIFICNIFSHLNQGWGEHFHFWSQWVLDTWFLLHFQRNQKNTFKICGKHQMLNIPHFVLQQFEKLMFRKDFSSNNKIKNQWQSRRWGNVRAEINYILGWNWKCPPVQYTDLYLEAWCVYMVMYTLCIQGQARNCYFTQPKTLVYQIFGSKYRFKSN